MKKREVSIEKNSGHKESFTRPRVASLQFTGTNHQRRSQSVKSLSIQNLHNSKSSNKCAEFKNDCMVLPDKMQPPKTRFNSRNGSKETCSTSSPRLKSFPAEEIKKLDNPPMFSPKPIAALIVQQDPQKTGTFYSNSSSKNNNEHGDSIFVQMPPQQQSESQNTCSVDQQQVVASHQKICQKNPHSESLLTRVASPEGQTHHPFVPNIPQGIVVYDRSPQSMPAIIRQPVITQIPSAQVAMPQTEEISSDSHAIVDQNPNGSSVPDNRCQKQLVNEQNPSNHQQMFVQMQRQKQTAIAQNASVPLNGQTAFNCRNIYHTHNQFHSPFPQKLQQINQQTQPAAYRQQMLPKALNQMQQISSQQQHVRNNSGTHSYYNQQLPVAQFPGQGMTSPQDMTVNQMRLMRHNLPVHQQNCGYPVNFQPVWSQNNRWMQTASQNQQQLRQQPSSYWQYYYQAPDASFNQQNSGSQDQSNPSSNQANNKPIINQPAAIAQAQRENKKTLQFTSDMIRDQELLVSIMRQQGVPEEVMHRQFNTLLNEQKRHLAYIAQFRQQETDNPKESKRVPFVRRIIEKNEKPEWMVHITPPRISYSDFERMKTQQRVLNERCLIDDKSLEKTNEIAADQQKNYHQPQNEEMPNQVSPQQMYVQENPHKPWQAISWPQRNDRQISYGHIASYPLYEHQQNASNNMRQPLNPTLKYAQYPNNMRHNPYFSHFEPQEVWPKEHNPSSLNPTDGQRTSYFYQQNIRPTETSSLLKMRVYKDLICPQNRNNGLQDPDNVQKMLEALKDPSGRKGLEYLANMSKKKPIVKLNGVQNSNEIPEDMQPRPSAETCSQSQKRMPANGLENRRNPNNPPAPSRFRPKRADEPLMTEYPRQRQNSKNCYSMQAEKENDATATFQNRDTLFHAQNMHGLIPYDRQNVPTGQGCCGNDEVILQYEESAPSQHYHPNQQYNLNGQTMLDHNGGQGDVAYMQRPNAPGANRIDRAGGDTSEKPNEESTKRIGGEQTIQGTNTYGQPEIRETRTIGGITYLVRKPECALNNHVVSPDKLIAHGQVPEIL